MRVNGAFQGRILNAEVLADGHQRRRDARREGKRGTTKYAKYSKRAEATAIEH